MVQLQVVVVLCFVALSLCVVTAEEKGVDANCVIPPKVCISLSQICYFGCRIFCQVFPKLCPYCEQCGLGDDPNDQRMSYQSSSEARYGYGYGYGGAFRYRWPGYPYGSRYGYGYGYGYPYGYGGRHEGRSQRYIWPPPPPHGSNRYRWPPGYGRYIDWAPADRFIDPYDNDRARSDDKSLGGPLGLIEICIHTPKICALGCNVFCGIFPAACPSCNQFCGLPEGTNRMLLTSDVAQPDLSYTPELRLRRDCPFDYELDEATNFCYKVMKRERTWDEARYFCRNDGHQVNLATLDDPRKVEHIRDYLKEAYPCDRDSCDVWVGGKDFNGNGKCTWVRTGQQFSEEILRFWAIGQPDGNGSCVSLLKKPTLHWGFNDLDCDERKWYVCEYSRPA